MQVQLARLHDRGDGTAAAATAAEIDELTDVLGVPLPPAIRTLYEDHGAEEPGYERCLRLLGPAEAARTIISLREIGVPFEGQELGIFWTDDNSNFAGVFTAGPLTHRVFMIDHEETSPEPRWRSVESFYDTLLDARDTELFWPDMATDYPRLPTDESPADDALADRLFAFHQEQPDGPAGRRAVFQALALCSATHAAQVMALLQSHDMWIQERAVQILGHWRWAPAIAGIAEVVRSGKPNGRTAGIYALKQIESRDARVALESLRMELGETYSAYFR